MTKGRILFVDDEPAILRSLLRVFRETDYDVHTANSGAEALELLEQQAVDLVLSDMKMPSMSGYQLLVAVKERYPDVMRLILSGYSDERETFRSLVDGTSRMYLLKPWDNDELLEAIDHLFSLQQRLQDNELLGCVRKISTLPTLPQLYQKISAMIQAEDDVRKIAKEIESDPAVAAKVLQIANSAFCGKRTGSIPQAVTYLGLTVLKNIVLACSVFGETQNKRMQSLLELLWRQASLTNQYMQLLAEALTGKKLAEDRSSAGLMHNIGKIVLLIEYPEKYTEMALAVEGQGEKMEAAEKEVLGVSHQEIGAHLLDSWNLPYPFVETALFHHDPLQASPLNRELTCLAHVANYFAWTALHAGAKPVLQEAALRQLNTTKEACEAHLAKDG